jgi:hypothetical protein
MWEAVTNFYFIISICKYSYWPSKSAVGNIVCYISEYSLSNRIIYNNANDIEQVEN